MMMNLDKLSQGAHLALLLLLALTTSVNCDEVNSTLTSTVSPQTLSTPASQSPPLTASPSPSPSPASPPASPPTAVELVNSRLAAVLKAHNITAGSRLLDLKPALGNVTHLEQCYEKGIVGKDTTLNMYGEGVTVEAVVRAYFEKLPNVINVQNADQRIGNLLHSMLLITDLVISCDAADSRDPIGLTPFSCLPVDQQTSMVG